MNRKRADEDRAPKPKPDRGAAAAPAHPRSVPILEEETAPAMPDQPFEEGAHDVVDPDLRHRMISEVAFRLYAERGFAEGSDVDDWLAAEQEVDHVLLRRPPTMAEEKPASPKRTRGTGRTPRARRSGE